MAWVRQDAVIIQQGSDGWERLLQLSAPVHMRYKERHNMDYWCISGTSTVPLPAHKEESWCMVSLIRQAVALDYKYIIFLGIDALIVQPDYDLRQACPPDALGMVWHTHDWALENEYDHFNMGNIFAGNGRNARIMLEDWWDYPPHDHHWTEQHSLNMAYKNRSVRSYSSDPIVPISPKYNSTEAIGDPDPIVVAWHGGGTLERRYELMKLEIKKRGL